MNASFFLLLVVAREGEGLGDLAGPTHTLRGSKTTANQHGSGMAPTETKKIQFVVWAVRYPGRILVVILCLSFTFSFIGISKARRLWANGELFMEGKQYDLGDIRSRRRDALDETVKLIRVCLDCD